jgi:chemotaxis response regulator CheB
VNVFLVDDSAVACRMVRALLSGSLDVVVVGEARSDEDAIRLIARLAPDVVVMNWSMPGMNGVEARPNCIARGQSAGGRLRTHGRSARARRVSSPRVPPRDSPSMTP